MLALLYHVKYANHLLYEYLVVLFDGGGDHSVGQIGDFLVNLVLLFVLFGGFEDLIKSIDQLIEIINVELDTMHKVSAVKECQFLAISDNVFVFR